MIDIDVMPTDLQGAAGAFARGQGQIASMWEALSLQLDPCAGMAGHPPDKAAVRFASQYDKAVEAAWRAFRASITSIGGMAQCLGKTAGVYLDADHHFTITVAGSGPPGPPFPPPAPPVFGLSSTLVVADKTEPAPPPALGAGSPGPGLLPMATADTGKLRTAASSWADAHTALTEVAEQLGHAIRPVIEPGTSDAEAINHVWSRIYTVCNDGTVLAALIELCGAISNSCTTYADAADHARTQAKAKLAAAAVPIVLIDGLGLFLTPESAGGSDAAAAATTAAVLRAVLRQIGGPLLLIVAGLAVGALGDHIIQAANNSADRAPQVKPTDADGKTVRKSADGEVKKTNREVADQAEKLGYDKRVPPQKAPFNSHGKPVFTDGKKYLTPDRDGHNTTNGWKIYTRRGQRAGTYDWNGNQVKG